MVSENILGASSGLAREFGEVLALEDVLTNLLHAHPCMHGVWHESLGGQLLSRQSSCVRSQSLDEIIKTIPYSKWNTMLFYLRDCRIPAYNTTHLNPKPSIVSPIDDYNVTHHLNLNLRAKQAWRSSGIRQTFGLGVSLGGGGGNRGLHRDDIGIRIYIYMLPYIYIYIFSIVENLMGKNMDTLMETGR